MKPRRSGPASRARSRMRFAGPPLAALALWLAQGLFRPAVPPSRPAPTAAAPSPALAHTASLAASAGSAAPPADTVFLLDDGRGVRRAYHVALDELYLSTLPAKRRLAAIPKQPDLAALIREAASRPEPDPRLVVYPVGAPRNARTRRIVGPRIEVALASAEAASPAPRPDLGILAWTRPAYAPDHAIAKIVGDPAQPLRAAAAAIVFPGVRSARPLLARQHFPRLVPNDPLFKDQWHLRNTGQQGGKSGVDIRAVPAWDDSTGAGVTIGVIDDGVDLRHPDLVDALDGGLGHDWNDDDSTPAAEDHEVEIDGETYPAYDDHGTAVAGLAAARGNNAFGVAGAAPSATLAALRLIAAPSDPAEDADAMAWRNDAIFIKNNSWGPPDADSRDGIDPDLHPADPLWLASVSDGVATGRGGLGTLYFWAAGNGQAGGDQGCLDGYSSARPVIPVAALTHTGLPASFSEGGPHLVVAAPGSARVGLATTDRSGDEGYNSSAYGYSGDYFADISFTKAFIGTSAATPVAAGVAALLLSKRPDLGWRDVKEIFLRSSTRLQSTSPDWATRPAGDRVHPIKHHPRLGGGLVNAADALALLPGWEPLGPELSLTALPENDNAFPIPDDTASAITLAFATPDDAPVLRVEHAVLTLDITHPYRGDLEITLASPEGTISRFTRATTRMAGLDHSDPSLGADYTAYPFTSVRHWGEASSLPSTPANRWTLRVRDALRGHAGILRSARLTLHGTKLAPPAKVDAPPDQTLATGSTLTLVSRFSGGNLDYQWSRNGAPIPGATGASLVLAKVSAKTAGTYVCTATNPLGSASISAKVAIDDSPRATIGIRVGTTAALGLADRLGENAALWRSTALPPGLRLDPATGLLGGRPTKPGQYRVTFTAVDADGTVACIPVVLDIPPLDAALVGNYVALVSRDPTLNADLGGSLSLTVNANGAATGRLVLGKTAHAFSGLLDGPTPTEDALLDIAVAKSALRLVLRLSKSAADAGLAGELGPAADPEAGARASIGGARSSWKASTHPASAYAGRSTAAFLPADQRDLPIGATILTLNITADGRARWLLEPADGSPALAGAGPLTDDGALLACIPYAGASGSFLIDLPAPSSANPGLPAGVFVEWLRKPAPALALPEGFGPLALASVTGGGRHVKPAAGSRILGLSSEANEVEAAWSTDAASLDQAARLDAIVTVSAKNTFSVAPPNSPKLSLAFAADTGRITGACAEPVPAPRTARIRAVVLPAAEPPRALGFAFAPGAVGTPPRSLMFVLKPAAD